MSDARNDGWLDRQLRDDARRTLADDGFTSRVMGALPPAPRLWLRPALILGSTALGGGLAAALSPVGPTILEGLRELSRFDGFTSELATLLAMTLTLAVSGYVLMED